MRERKREMNTTPNEGASMNPVPKAVMISDEELSALSVMSQSISLDMDSAIEEILKNEDSFVIQAKDEEGHALDDFLVINAETKQAARFINSVSSEERYAFLIPYDIIEEILLMMSERNEENIH